MKHSKPGPTRGATQQGSQFDYSDLAIWQSQMTLTIREVFRLTNRATKGFVQSLFQLLNVDLKAPDYSTLSRRGKALKGHSAQTDARRIAFGVG